MHKIGDFTDFRPPAFDGLIRGPDCLTSLVRRTFAVLQCKIGMVFAVERSPDMQHGILKAEPQLLENVRASESVRRVWRGPAQGFASLR